MVILFDLDGTVIDSTEPIVASFQHAFVQMSKEPPRREQIFDQIGHPLDVMFENLCAPRELISDFVTIYKEKYREISFAGTFLIDGAKEAIELASSFATLGVVTTKTSKYSAELLEYLGVMHHFGTLVGREDVVYPKPNAEPILTALSRLGKVADENSWMIGDTMMDIDSAKNAGISHVGVFTGYAPKDIIMQGAKHYADNALLAVELIRQKI